MSRIAVNLGMTVVIIAVIVLTWHCAGQKAPGSASRQPAGSIVDAPAGGALPVDPSRGLRPDATAAVSAAPQDEAERTAWSDRPVPPPVLGDWYRWSESQRLEFVTNAQHDSHLPVELLAFFRLALRDRTLGLVTRNNLANCLVGQEARDPTLAAAFTTIVQDATEEVKWRDYALQFLATSLEWSDHPRELAAAIWDQAQHGPGTMSGTALLHLHYLDERGVSPLPVGYGERLGTCLSDPAVDLSTRMTAVGIVGQRHLRDQAQIIRGLVEQASEPALRRTALATLGAVGDPGDPGDVALVRRFTADPDPLIAAAAKGAERRLVPSAITPTDGTTIGQSEPSTL